MRPAQAALFRAICESPEADAPRLAYADWLEKHGDPDRAEFIRLQVGREADTISHDRRTAAHDRVYELFRQHGSGWEAELPRPDGVEWVLGGPGAFRRGFPFGVSFRDGTAWRDHATEVFAAAPVATLMCWEMTAEMARAVFASPLYGRVINSQTPLDPAGAEALADNPHLTGRLRALAAAVRIRRPGDGDAVTAALARAAGLRGLESLHVHCEGPAGVPGVGPAGVAALAGSPHLAGLEYLDLDRNRIGDDGAEVLAGSPHLRNLETLHLCDTGVGDRGAAALARSPYLTSLRELLLGGCPITDTGALALATTAGLPGLESLHLWDTRVGAVGARALLAFADRRGLWWLSLRGCPLPRALAREMRRRLRPEWCDPAP
jgi:uncharacterized protein (TIGR02996 family)